jgi:hypothetical protein
MAANDRLAPPTAAQVWRQFLLWVLGVPLVLAGAGGIIAGALWLTQGEMMWQAFSDMATALMWMAFIALIYPAMLFVWVSELREGLARAREWQALSPAEQAARIAAQATAAPKRRRRGKRA